MLTSQQLAELEALKEAGDPVTYYSYLRDAGVGYATLALGVASDATSGSVVADFGGLYALNYLKEKYRQFNGEEISEVLIQQVKVSLMQADFAVRARRGGVATGEEIARYHYRVFTDLGIPESAWTGDTLHRRINDQTWCLTPKPSRASPVLQVGVSGFTTKRANYILDVIFRTSDRHPRPAPAHQGQARRLAQ